jgi:hypothetical protein
VSPLAIVPITHPIPSSVEIVHTIAKNEQPLAVVQSARTRQVSQVELAAQAALHAQTEAQATATAAISSIALSTTIAKNEQQFAVLQSARERQVSQVELAAQAALPARIEAQAPATAAISSIAVSTTVRAVAPNATRQAQPSPRDFVLYGDSGLLIQSNNAAATIGRLLLPVVYPTRVAPAVPPVGAITPLKIRLVAR